IFPHHENEIAQSEGANGKTFAKYWLHNGMVNLGGQKMAKSTGHLIDLTEAIEIYGGPAVRLFYLRAHYRSPLEFTEALIDEARTALRRISGMLDRVDRSSHDAEPEVIASFVEKMDDDFNTPEALGIVFDTVREANRRLDAGEEAGALAASVVEMIDVLGVTPEAGGEALSDVSDGVNALAEVLGVDEGATIAATLDNLLARRAAARVDRDFATSDRIRDELAALGIGIEDGPDGSQWHRR
ncbi:MAG TPA: DALR domain-containing protein, partial [Acidimicrobiia bacterium]